MNKLIVLCLTLLLLFGCKKYSLSNETLEWQPYNVGDILIFESNKNEIDTLVVKSIMKNISQDDPLDLTPNLHEGLSVSGEITRRRVIRTSLGKYIYKENMSLINFSADKTVYIYFNFKRKSDSLKYPITSLALNKLEEKFKEQKKSKFNAIRIEAVDAYNPNRDYDLKNFLWSKEFGLVRQEFKNEYSIELTKFIRDGKNILNN